jgi:hypothetical protein
VREKSCRLRFFSQPIDPENGKQEEAMENVRRRIVLLTCVSGLLLHLPLAASGNEDRGRTFKISYSKWADTTSAPGFRLLRGFTGGDIVGDFFGQVFVREVSWDGRVNRLEAEYSVTGDRSFTAMMRGAADPLTGDAILDGTILAGWRTGAHVHAEFATIQAPSPNDPACPGHPPGLPCNLGTMWVGQVPRR